MTVKTAEYTMRPYCEHKRQRCFLLNVYKRFLFLSHFYILNVFSSNLNFNIYESQCLS